LFEPVCAEPDELAADARGWADELDERLSAWECHPTAARKRPTEQARFPSCPAGVVDDAEAVALVLVRLNEIIEECPRWIVSLRDCDPVSEHLFFDLATALVKQRWVIVSPEDRCQRSSSAVVAIVVPSLTLFYVLQQRARLEGE
jgi:DNA-binding ferritin-like protein